MPKSEFKDLCQVIKNWQNNVQNPNHIDPNEVNPEEATRLVKILEEYSDLFPADSQLHLKEKEKKLLRSLSTFCEQICSSPRIDISVRVRAEKFLYSPA